MFCCWKILETLLLFWNCGKHCLDWAKIHQYGGTANSKSPLLNLNQLLSVLTFVIVQIVRNSQLCVCLMRISVLKNHISAFFFQINHRNMLNIILSVAVELYFFTRSTLLVIENFINKTKYEIDDWVVVIHRLPMRYKNRMFCVLWISKKHLNPYLLVYHLYERRKQRKTTLGQKLHFVDMFVKDF